MFTTPWPLIHLILDILFYMFYVVSLRQGAMGSLIKKGGFLQYLTFKQGDYHKL